MANNVINLDDVLKTSLSVVVGDDTYRFPLDDKSELAVDDVLTQVDALVKDLGKDPDALDNLPAEEQVKATHDAYKKRNEIVMAYFTTQLGKTKATALYNAVGKSTQGLTVILGLINKAADKSVKDMAESEYPAFKGND